MTWNSPANDPDRFALDSFRSYWILFLGMGVFFMAGGLVAMTVPVYTTSPHNKVLGLVLLLTGLVEIIQAGKMQRTSLFALCLGLGGVAVVGGALVYIEPFSDIRIKMAVMALVFALHGLVQILMAYRLRRLKGWLWLGLAGLAAVAVGILLESNLPYSRSFTPATVGGASILLTGVAYAMVALVARRG